MDINNFGPFNANTWGSVSDWAMVAVTALTANYIYKTLRSQTVVQELQQKSFKIDEFNHRMNIRPKFNIHLKKSTFEIDRLIIRQQFFIKTTLNVQKARDVSFNFNDENKVLIRNGKINHNYDFVQPDSSLVFNLTLQTNFFYSNGEPSFWENIDLLITYSDIEKNRYLQRFYLLIGAKDDDCIVIPHEPEIVPTL